MRLLIAALMLAGCTTIPYNAIDSDSLIRQISAQAEQPLRALLEAVDAAGAPPDYGTALLLVDAVRADLAGRAVLMPGAVQSPGRLRLLALGVTLTVCREGVARMAIAADKADVAAADAARRQLATLCLAPLAVFASA